MIYTERNRRSKITKDEQILGTVREEHILQAIPSFVSSIRSINVPVDEVLDLVNKNYT
ncbi:hypothetical protein [Virgibacillus halodenitrificans]|uniref:hypothetical protein n=1 Tax=Virgibacillus halodenitrificans TaxID=1482 RepID=UPI003083D16A